MRATLFLLVPVVLGCASARPTPPPPELLLPEPPPGAAAAEVPDESVQQNAATAPAAVPSPAPAGEPPPPSEGTVAQGTVVHGRGTIRVIDEGGRDDQQGGLAAASRAQKERRAADPPDPDTLTITDKNLKEHATGELTYADDKPQAAADPRRTPGGHPESWWREEIRRRRQSWSHAVNEILELEAKVAQLRDRFYAEADPWVRDSRVKPEWDRTLDLLARAKDNARLSEREVETFLEQGRRDNALPGWLREGIELEPNERPYHTETDERRRTTVGEPALARDVVGEPRTVDE